MAIISCEAFKWRFAGGRWVARSKLFTGYSFNRNTGTESLSPSVK